MRDIQKRIEKLQELLDEYVKLTQTLNKLRRDIELLRSLKEWKHDA